MSMKQKTSKLSLTVNNIPHVKSAKTSLKILQGFIISVANERHDPDSSSFPAYFKSM